MIAVVAALVLATQPQPYNGAVCDQGKADEGLQIEMNICAADGFRIADQELNAAWAMASSVARERDRFESQPDEPSFFAILREAQRAWLVFRDAHCKVEADRYRGGSIRPLIYSSCKEGLTRARTQQLRDYTQEG